MKRKRIVVAEKNLRERLLPLLLGQVFHVTTQEAFRAIIRIGAIKNNQAGVFRFNYPQSEESYFRYEGCVSFFDLRSMTESRLDEEIILAKFNFLNPAFATNRPVFLFLKESCFKQLISSERGIEKMGVRAKLIPHAESGYPGDVPLGEIGCALLVNVKMPSPTSRSRKDAILRRVNNELNNPTSISTNAPKPSLSEVLEAIGPLPEDATRRAIEALDRGDLTIDVTVPGTPEDETRKAIDARRISERKTKR